jgi:hypothetical protein
MTRSTSPIRPDLKADYKEAYRYHASTLRNWYVAFGIGAPVLLLSNEYLWKKILASCHLDMICLTFSLGVAVQILLALFDKYASWINYYKSANGNLALNEHLETVADCWMEDNFISIILDIGSLILFEFAAFITFSVIRA